MNENKSLEKLLISNRNGLIMFYNEKKSDHVSTLNLLPYRNQKLRNHRNESVSDRRRDLAFVSTSIIFPRHLYNQMHPCFA